MNRADFKTHHFPLFALRGFLVPPHGENKALSDEIYKAWEAFDVFGGPLAFDQHAVSKTWIGPHLAMMDGKKDSQRLNARLAGQLLLDLGGGAQNWVDTLATHAGVAATIRVDLSPLEGLDAPFDPVKNIVPANEDIWEGTQRVTICADMLDFLQYVPSGSCNVTVNGIDSYYILKIPAYHQALAKEISRVVKPDGLVFGLESDCLDLLLDAGTMKIAQGLPTYPTILTPRTSAPLVTPLA